MAADFTYDVAVVYNDATGTVAKGVSGYFLDDIGGTAQPIYDLNRSPLTSIVANADGVSPRFKADLASGYLIFGTIALPVISQEVIAAAIVAQSLVDTANAAAQNAANAASAAQAAAQQVADLIAAGGGGGGLDIVGLETQVGGAPGVTQGLISKLPSVRKKTGGVWPAKIAQGFSIDLAIGTAPGPTDQDADGDTWIEVAL